MKACTFLVPCVCAGVFVAACTTVDYELPANQSAILSPDTNEVPFALRSTTLLLVPASTSSTAARTNPNSIVLTDLCNQSPTSTGKKPAKAAFKPAGRSRRPAGARGGSEAHIRQAAAQGVAAQTPAVASSDTTWATCINKANVVATPVRSNVYIAKFHGDNTITTASLDGEPLLLKTVSIGAGNTASNTVTSVGANVVAGVAMASGWGWAAVGVASLWEIFNAADKLGFDQGKLPPTDEDNLVQQLCTSAREEDQTGRFYTYMGYKKLKTEQPSLSLPIAFPATLPDKGDLGCWMPLPTFSSTEPKPILPRWFYRIMPADPDVAPGVTNADSHLSNPAWDWDIPPVIGKSTDNLGDAFVLTATFFDTKTPYKDQDEYFPTTACRAVEVDITSWDDLAKTKRQPAPASSSSSAMPASASSTADAYYKAFNITVAEANYIQLVAVRKNQVINVGTVCGGYASSTPVPASNSDFSGAIVQTASTVIKAQDQAKSSTSK